MKTMVMLKRPSGPLYYEILGEGDQTVFIAAGMSFTSRFYKEFASQLVAQDDSLRVILFDHRGLGRSAKANLSWTTTVYENTHDIIAVADECGAERFAVIGESYGGMLAIALGITHPERLTGIVAISSSVGGTLLPRISPRALLRMVSGSVSEKILMGQMVKNIFSPSVLKDRPEVVERWKKIRALDPLLLVTARKQLLAAARFAVHHKLSHFSTPTLVVYGSDDQMVSPLNSFAIHHRVPGATLVKFEGGGHHLCGEEPEELARVCAEFLSEGS